MKAILTFVRKLEDNTHFIGVDNPINIDELNKFNLISGQPVICVVNNNILTALYLIKNDGELFQVHGENDFLFDIKNIYDFTLINLNKFNLIKYYLINTYSCLSLNEFEILNEDMLSLENKIFYDLLHTELASNKLKNYILRIIKKSDLKFSIRERLLKNLNITKYPNNKIFIKKIDLNLSGYDIYINTFVK